MAEAARLSTGWQLRHEGVSVAVEGGIEGAWGGGVVGGVGGPRHVGVVPSHRDVVAPIVTGSPKESGVVKRRARGVELRHERVSTAVVEGGIEGAWGGGIVGGGGAPRHVGPAVSHRDAAAVIQISPKERSPKEGGVVQRRARRVELGNEGVLKTV